MTAKHKMTGSWHAESTNTPHCKVGKGRYSDNRSPGYLRVFLKQIDIYLPLFYSVQYKPYSYWVYRILM